VQAEITPELERLLDTSRSNRRAPLTRELMVDAGFALAFMGAAVTLALLGDAGSPSALTAACFVAAYALMAGADFQSGAGFALPTQIVFVPMLLLLDPSEVPLLIAAALALKALVRSALGLQPLERVVVGISDAWFALGPAILLTIANPGLPTWGDWPIIVAAMGAQVLTDGIISPLRAYLCVGVPPRQVLTELVEAYRVDLLLAPLGMLAAIAAAPEHPLLALLSIPLAVLMHTFSEEREQRIEQQLELSRAYRGTALLLGDVIEDDDEYTGQHTRGVVILAGMVADELDVDASTRRDTEFGALLHDVGKIAIPKEIINKPGPLDDDEWVVMKTHTIEGQRLLERVGGILGRVGVVVRASHERWDGKGYPDGLTAEDIPLAARIVACCDAYNAMTTDRSYRSALPVPVALAELRANAGTQFDPQVVDTVVTLIERWDPEMVAGEDDHDVDAAIRALLAGPDEE
jgi:HD-GYP domain-containing protein (c-di-GMP phosphodiesterase class II)